MADPSVATAAAPLDDGADLSTPQLSTAATPSAAAAPQFSPSALATLPDEPDFKALPPDQRSQLYDTLAANVSQSLQNSPEMTPENWQRLGQVIDQNRAKIAPTLAEQGSGMASSVGSGVADLGKDVAAVAGSIPFGLRHPIDTAVTVGRSGLYNALDWGRTGAEAALRRIPGTNAHRLDQALTDVKQKIDAGKEFPLGKPDALAQWVREQSEQLAPLQSQADVGPHRALASGKVAPLLARYIHTRNPEIWKQLAHEMSVPIAEENLQHMKESILSGDGAKEFDDWYGKGASQHILAAADPANLLMLGRAGAAVRTGGRVLKAAKFAGEMGAFGAANALRADTNASLSDIGHEALKSLLLGGVLHAGGTVVRRIVGNGPVSARDKLRQEAIKEAKTEDGSKTSTQLTMSPVQAKPFVDFAQSIPDSKLYGEVDTEWANDSRETEPHVTVLYGLHDPEPSAATKIISQAEPITVKMGKTSIFSNDKYDVLKVDVTGPKLHALNRELSKLPNSNSYPTYKPHVTIAYLKKGEGERYAGDTRFEGQEMTFRSVTHSPPSKIRKVFGRPELPLAGSGANASIGRAITAQASPTTEGVAAALFGTDPAANPQAASPNAPSITPPGVHPNPFAVPTAEQSGNAMRDAWAQQDREAQDQKFRSAVAQLGTPTAPGKSAAQSAAAITGHVPDLGDTVHYEGYTGTLGMDEQGRPVVQLPDGRTIVEVSPDGEEPRRAGPPPHGTVAGNWKNPLESWADRTIAEAKGRTNVLLLPDTPLFAAYAVKGASLLAHGLRDFGDWSARMIATFGKHLRPKIATLWHAAHEYFKGALAHARRTSETGAVNIFGYNALHGGTPLEHARTELTETSRTLKQKWSARGAKKLLAAREDVVDNKPSLVARQAGNWIRRGFGFKEVKGWDLFKQIRTGKDHVNERANLDAQGATLVTEAFQDVVNAKKAANAAAGTPGAPASASIPEGKAALQGQMSRIRASGQGHEYLPLFQHALANFDDLAAKSQDAHTLMKASRAAEIRHGIESAEVEHYVTHVYGNLDEMKGKDAPQELFGGTDAGASSSKYFTKNRKFNTLADAITEGYKPQSFNIADLAEHRFKTGQRLIERAKNRQMAFTMTDPSTGKFIAKPVTPGDSPPPDYVRIDAAGTPIDVYDPYKGIFKALYGESGVRNSTYLRAASRIVSTVKHGTVAFDMLHLFNVMYRSGFGAGTLRRRNALLLADHSLPEISAMEASGEINTAQADWVRSNQPKYMELLDAGLMSGRQMDALYDDSRSLLGHLISAAGWAGAPFRAIEQFNHFVFQKATRAGMVEVALNFAERNEKTLDLSHPDAVRLAAVETNRMFGNVGRQGFLKSRTFQDLARMILFAPQWFEGTFTMELQGAAQLLKAPFSPLIHKRFMMGNVARTMSVAALGILAANQVINYATTGHSTFQNENGHQLDAWIPGGAHGFHISPFSVMNRTTESMLRYTAEAQPQTAGQFGSAVWDSVLHVAQNKLSGPARGVATAMRGTDYAGRPVEGLSGRAVEGIMSSSPLPIPLSPFLARNPGEWPRVSLQGSEPGAWERQAAASLGIHLMPAQGPTDKMYALAKPFRSDQTLQHAPGKYTLLRRALRNGQTEQAADELRRLIASGTKLETLQQNFFKPLSQVRFTDSEPNERALIASLKTPEQKQLYKDALKEHADLGQHYANLLRPRQQEMAALQRQTQQAQGQKRLALMNGE